jgi:hypothetical protein
MSNRSRQVAMEHNVLQSGSKLAEMMATAHEGEKYNQLTKEWEKI